MTFLPLNNQWFPFWYLRPLVHHLDASTTSRCRWLDDPFTISMAVSRPQTMQLLQIGRYDECSWHKAEFLFPMLHHLCLQITPNSIFTTDLKWSGYMIDFLIRSNGFEAWTFHMFAPNAHPIVGFWNENENWVTKEMRRIYVECELKRICFKNIYIDRFEDNLFD